MTGPTMTDAVWLDATGAAARASVSTATVLRAARRGYLRAFKIGAGRKLWRFRPADIDEWIMAGATPDPFVPRPLSVTAASTIPEHRLPTTLVEASPRRRAEPPGDSLAEEG